MGKHYKVGQRNSSGDKQRIKAIRDHAQGIHALTMELQPDEAPPDSSLPHHPTHDGAPMAKASPAQMQGLRDGTVPGGFVGEDESCPVCGPEDVQAAWDMCCVQTDPECCDGRKKT